MPTDSTPSSLSKPCPGSWRSLPAAHWRGPNDCPLTYSREMSEGLRQVEKADEVGSGPGLPAGVAVHAAPAPPSGATGSVPALDGQHPCTLSHRPSCSPPVALGPGAHTVCSRNTCSPQNTPAQTHTHRHAYARTTHTGTYTL